MDKDNDMGQLQFPRVMPQLAAADQWSQDSGVNMRGPKDQVWRDFSFALTLPDKWPNELTAALRREALQSRKPNL